MVKMILLQEKPHLKSHSIMILALTIFGMCTSALQAVTRLSVDSPTHHFITPQIRHFDQGYIDQVRATRLHIVSDQDWVLKVYTPTIRMGSRKPVHDFQLKLNGQNTWSNLSQSRHILRQGNAGNYTFYIDYRLRLHWEQDSPGNYRANIKYIITSPV